MNIVIFRIDRLQRPRTLRCEAGQEIGTQTNAFQETFHDRRWVGNHANVAGSSIFVLFGNLEASNHARNYEKRITCLIFFPYFAFIIEIRNRHFLIMQIFNDLF